MPSDPIELDDVIVLLLGAPSTTDAPTGRIEGITRLEKLVFLYEREFGENWLEQDAGFIAHNFGPFSAEVYKAVDMLSAAGLVRDTGKIGDSREDTWESAKIIGTEEGDPYATRDFELTDLGHEYYEALVSELPSDAEDRLAKFKRKYATLKLRQLIRYVYEHYKDFTDKSLIRDAVMR